jgi:hypothetical protein
MPMRNGNKICLTCGKPCDPLRIAFKSPVLVRFCDDSCRQKYLQEHTAEIELDEENILRDLMTEEDKAQIHNQNKEAKRITQDMLGNVKLN